MYLLVLCSQVMKIIFLGQPTPASQELNRIEHLAVQAIANGHAVVPYYGFIKNIIGILAMRMTKPNTIHVHGWNTAILFVFLQLFAARDTVRIWTIERIPSTNSSFQERIFQYFISMLAPSFSQICVPTRTLQYRLLSLYGIKAFYIPDGYTEPVLQDIQPREYGLRNNQYGMILSQSIDAITHIAQAYSDSQSKKKLVILSRYSSPDIKKLTKSYPFITPISLPATSRGAQSMVRSAGFVVMCEPAYSPLLLQAMDTNRVVIATTNPLHEEILGTTGFYYQEQDMTHLAQLLQKAAKGVPMPKYSPSTRAKHHFLWEKTGLEYEHFYGRKTTKLVPFDSLIAKRALI